MSRRRPSSSRTSGSPLRVGLAGLGTMGRNHLRNLLARQDVTLVAVADPDQTARQSAEQQAPEARGFDDARAMLEEEQLDALVVAVPTALHYAIAAAGIERGVAVLVEKPLAGTVAEARDLVELAGRRGALLQVGHVERFNPAVRELRQRLQAGGLSRVFSVRTIRAGPIPERMRDSGVAVDLATHDVDIICHLIGERPIRAYAEVTQHVHTDHEDLLYGLLAFPGGALGQLDVNWLTPEKQRRLVVLGEEGMFTVDYLSQSLTFTRRAADLSPTYLDGYAPTFIGQAVHLPVRPAEPLRLELDAFFAAVRAGGPSPLPGADGLWAVALAEMLLVSAAEHRPVEVAPLEVG